MTTSFIWGDALKLALADESVHLVVSSPPYFALRSYQDGGEHFDGQMGSEESPFHFLAALWKVMDECWRVLRKDGSCWINLGDKMSNSGGHNNSGISSKSTLSGNGHVGGVGKKGNHQKVKATRRSAPDAYNKNSGGLREKTRMILPHRFYEGCIDPEYRAFTEQRAGLKPTPNAPQWIGRMDVVWAKANGMPESVTDRVRASHEYWFHLVKSPTYYSSLDAVRGEYSPKTFTTVNSGWGKANPTSQFAREKQSAWNDEKGVSRSDAMNSVGPVPGSVWRNDPDETVWDVATEPLRLPKYIILGGPGDLVPSGAMPTDDDAWRWCIKRGITASLWPRHQNAGPHIYATPDHFAAFPTTFPKRIVQGWSPSGVCTKCGEGRRPTVDAKPMVVRPGPGREGRMDAANGSSSSRTSITGTMLSPAERTIIGEQCACPMPDAPTKPAIVLDMFSGTGTTSAVASALGRHGIGVELSADYLRIANWRARDQRLVDKVLERKPKKAAVISKGWAGLLFDDEDAA